MAEERNLFTRLKKLFSADVVVRNIGGRKLKVIDVDKLQTLGVKTNYQVDRYSRVFHPGSYSYNAQISFQTSRLQLYNDYEVMDSDPIIGSALDIYADESTTKNEYGDILDIRSDDEQVSSILRNLFYDVLNIEFNMWMWIRNMCKYGNQYLKLDISEKYGVVNVVPIPVYECTREEMYDQKNPHAVRFVVQGAYGRGIFENYEIADFRLLTDSNFLPYGRAMIELARKGWKQLTLMEDAMLIHRIMRAPEKRVFKVDIGNIPPQEVDQYMQKLIDKMKKTPYIDPQTGDYNLKFNMMNMIEDFYLPVRGGEGTTSIDTIKGLEFSAIDDIEYIKHKMMAALKVPKAFLGYEEGIGAKSTLAAEDVRFARTIERIQRIVVSELTTIAIIHLYSQGITDSRLVNFELALTNPSTIAEQEKLALWATKVGLANDALTQNPFLSSDWMYKNVFGFNDEKIEEIRKQILDDKKRGFRYAQIEGEGNDPIKTGQSFGTPHDLAALNATVGARGDESIDYGDTNFDPDRPAALEPELQYPNANIGRPAEGPKYGQDSHIRGRDPLGAKGVHHSLETDKEVGYTYKGGNPLTREQIEKKRKVEQTAKYISALKRIPEKFKKSKVALMESIEVEGEKEIEKSEENGDFLDESRLDLHLDDISKTDEKS